MAAARDAPLFVMTRLAWDDTGEKVTAGMGDAGETSVRHVLVSRLRLFKGWQTPGGIRCFSYVFILSPMVVPGTAARQIWHALFYSQLTGSLVHVVHILRRRAQIVINLHETGGALSNERLYAHLLARSGAPGGGARAMCCPPTCIGCSGRCVEV